MESLLKYCGAIIVLLGVVFLVIYHLATKSNALLVLSIVLILAGIVAHVILNRRVQ